MISNPKPFLNSTNKYLFSAVLVFCFLFIQVGLSGQGVITVGLGVQYDFTTISDAISSALTNSANHDSITIQLADDTYLFEEPITINMNSSSLGKLTIESISGNESCILYAEPEYIPIHTQRIFKIWGNHQKSFSIRGISFSYWGEDNTMIRVATPMAEVSITESKFDFMNQVLVLGDASSQPMYINISNNDFTWHERDELLRFALEIGRNHVSSQTNINITNNNFTNVVLPISITIADGYIEVTENVFDNNADEFDPEAGYGYNILCIDRHVSGQGEINLDFKSNQMINTYLTLNAVQAQIEDNLFWKNDINVPYSFSLELMNRTDSINSPVSYVSILRNMFYGFDTNQNASFIVLTSPTETYFHEVNLKAVHNTFISNFRALTIESRAQNAPNSVGPFTNNLISCNSDPLIHLQHSRAERIEVNIDYSIFENGYPQDTGTFIIDQNTCVVADPLIDVDTDAKSYTLIWDTNQKSPCINSGYPGTNNEITDPDGTPPDIGSVFYPHHNKVYSFPLQTSQPPYIYWMSFPVVDDRTFDVINNESMYWNELRYMFDSHIQGVTPQLNSIEWSYDPDYGKMYLLNQVWQNSAFRANSPIGFKIAFEDSPIDNIVVNGFKSDPESTPALWDDTINSGNWVGYFVPQTQCAFSSLMKEIPGYSGKTYLDYIYCIKTQHWSTNRLKTEPGSPWVIGPERYTFSEGDMAVLFLLDNAPSEMFWNVTQDEISPYSRQQPEFFTYEEMLDYTPVYIEFDPEDIPNEVGIMVNGVCKGAAVVDFDLIGVNLYIEEAKTDDIEIVFYYANKGKKKMSGWKVYNPETLVFEDTIPAGILSGKYIYLSFVRETGSSIVPLVTALEQNYPNPFNPDTKISFTLAEPMPVSLEVFNLKGQKIKTLANGNFSKGRHALTWNARDERDRKVASGIYFYRLTTPQGKHTAKMILMK